MLLVTLPRRRRRVRSGTSLETEAGAGGNLSHRSLSRMNFPRKVGELWFSAACAVRMLGCVRMPPRFAGSRSTRTGVAEELGTVTPSIFASELGMNEYGASKSVSSRASLAKRTSPMKARVSSRIADPSAGVNMGYVVASLSADTTALRLSHSS